jgi:hypothetical protein
MSARRSGIARFLIVALLAGVLCVVQAVTSPSQAAPLSPSAEAVAASSVARAQIDAAAVVGFDPGNILSDAAMYDSKSMTAASIQTFLNSKGASCSPTAGNTCIKAYKETTPTRTADALCTGSYIGAANESAATIIAKVSAACGISPRVLLVTLQKEQGLITSTAGKSAYTYSRALGFGCPDNVGGWCNPQYAGFANQVYSAAKQLKRYAANPNSYSYRAGRTNTILWHPNTACGSSQVYISNQATASLYNYTPYRPNQAALNAGYGSGDSCSSYGNRNFYLYFTAWFGTAQTGQREPIGSIDVARASSSNTIQVAGWAFDPDVATSGDVHFYVDGVGVLATKASGSRPDVGALYNRSAATGYDVTLKVSQGAHNVCVYAIDGNGGSNKLLGCRSVTVTNNNPRGSFDVAQAAGPGLIQVAGWAFDPDSAGSIDVHVYVDGKAVLATKATGSRPDVAKAFSRGAAVGFDVRVKVSAGNHNVCVYAIDSGGGTNVLLGCRTAQSANKQPQGTIDVIQPAGPGKVQVRGWAFDPDTSAAIDMHVYVDGAYSRTIKANTSRPDVGAAYGRGSNHGYDSVIPMVAGKHSVCLYAIDSTGGTNPYLGCRSVTVANTPAVGAVDPATTTAAFSGGVKPTITVTGWAWDFDTTAPVKVRVLINGIAAKTAVANLTHASVAGVPRTTIGFTATAVAGPKKHSVCVEALDPQSNAYVSLGCQDVTVPNANPVGVLDDVRGIAGAGAAKPKIRVAGWAQDYDTTEPISVHIYVDGVQLGNVVAKEPRPDVEAIHKNGALHGFTTTIDSTPGSHTVCAYSINVPQGTNHMIGTQCTVVTVP